MNQTDSLLTRTAPHCTIAEPIGASCRITPVEAPRTRQRHAAASAVDDAAKAERSGDLDSDEGRPRGLRTEFQRLAYSQEQHYTDAYEGSRGSSFEVDQPHEPRTWEDVRQSDKTARYVLA